MKARSFRVARANALSCLWRGNVRRARKWAAVARDLWAKEQKPEEREMARRSQRKGRNAELKDIKRWINMGFTVMDKRALEAAGVSLGVDYEVWKNGEKLLAVQRKHGKQPNALGAYREIRDATKGTLKIPVAHVQKDYGPDVAVLPWIEFEALIQQLYGDG